MKTFKWLLLAVVVIVGLALATTYKSRRPKLEMAGAPEQLMAPVASEVVPAAEELVEPQAGEAFEAQAEEDEMANAPEEAPPEEEPPQKPIFLPMVTLLSDTVLAAVNGVDLMLQDLMPINSAVVTEQSLRADAYDELLDRAIAREVTFQAAKARGVELDPAQQGELEEIRAGALARAGAPYMMADYDAEAQAAFEVRDRTAQLMQNALLGVTGRPSDYITPEQVQEYYEAHSAEFDKLPKDAAAREKAWAPIETEIRNRLISEIFIQHEQKRRQLLEELKAGAAIEQFVRPEIGGTAESQSPL